MAKKTTQSAASAMFDPLSAALSEINALTGGKETEKSILAHSVYLSESVVVVISTGQKYVVPWARLAGPGRSDLPDTTLNQ